MGTAQTTYLSVDKALLARLEATFAPHMRGERKDTLRVTEALERYLATPSLHDDNGKQRPDSAEDSDGQ